MAPAIDSITQCREPARKAGEDVVIGIQLSIQAARRPHDIAIVFGQQRWTYRDLHRRSCRLAAGLSSLGVTRGDRVATLLHNSPHCIEALFACALLGAVCVPFNFRLVAREIGLQLQSATPKVLLAGEGFAAVLDGLPADAPRPDHVRWLDDEPATDNRRDHPHEVWLAAQPDAEPPQCAASEDMLMLLHSSGTTGLPKGVIFTHGTTFASCTAKIIDFGLRDDDVTVVFGPLFHAGPLMDLALPLLLRGGRLVIGASRHFEAQGLLETIAAERGTVIPIYPTMLRRVLATPADPALDLSCLRLIITGGEAAPLPVILGTHDRFPWVDFVNNYGSTEGGPVTTFLPAAESRSRTGSVGRESFGVQVRIADATGQPLGAGEVGELLVRSPFVCGGYWHRPEATAAALRDGWWWTGDLARRDADGCLWITGRSKDMIKSGAENIYPIEVEQAIAALPGVVEVGVIGVPDEQWGETVAAFVVVEPDSGLDAARVVAHCREQLASYKKPRHVRFVDSLPRGTTSKVDKNRLRAIWAATAGADR